MKTKFPAKMVFSFLVLPYEEGGFLGMCRETGIIKNANTSEEVKNKLIKSTELLIDTAIKDGRYIPSLSCGLPWKYRLIFYTSIIRIFAANLIHRASEMMYFTKLTSNLMPMHG